MQIDLELGITQVYNSLKEDEKIKIKEKLKKFEKMNELNQIFKPIFNK